VTSSPTKESYRCVCAFSAGFANSRTKRRRERVSARRRRLYEFESAKSGRKVGGSGDSLEGLPDDV